jgi:ABC-type uncharacterized transport system auxiliary subunit
MVMRNSKRRFAGVLLAVLFSLAACSGLTKSDKPAITTWWLKPYDAMATVDEALRPVPVFVTVTAIPGLDTDKILTLSSDSELKPYSAARWVDNLPELSQSLVVRSLEASGHFKVLSAGGRSVAGHCELRLELREFYATLDSSGQGRDVKVAFEGQNICDSETAVPIRLIASLPIEGTGMSNIVATFQRTFDELMKDLLKQL